MSQIDIPGVGLVEFPDTMSDADISKAAAKLHADATTPSTTTGLKAAAGTATLPVAANLAERLATSPTAAKIGGAIANSGTTIAGIIHGVRTGNIPEIIASPIAGWQAGKGGYWLTKRAQDVAGPIANGLEKVAPYANAATGALGAVDLAAMAHDNRPGHTIFGPGGTVDPQHVPVMNEISAVIAERLGGKDLAAKLRGTAPWTQ